MESEFISWDKIHKGTDKEGTGVTSPEEAGDPAETTDPTATNDPAAATDPAERFKDLPVDEDGIRQFITKDMLIGDVIEIYPEATRALLSVGMHCVTCGVALYESVEEASYVHGLDPDDVIKVVNDMLTTELIEHPGEGVTP